LAERKEILRDKKIRFDYRSAIPSLTLIVALLTEILIPNHMDAKYRTLTNFKSVLITFTVVSLLLLLISIFHETCCLSALSVLLLC